MIGVGFARGELAMLKEGIPKQSQYKNQALNEADPFRSTARDLERTNDAGFEMMQFTSRGAKI